MGPYCRYCDRRCFVIRRIPSGPHEGFEGLLATCPRGAAADREAFGHDHTTATNPLADLGPVSVPGTLADAARRARQRGNTTVAHTCEDAALRLALQTPAAGGCGGSTPLAAGINRRNPEYRTDPR